MPTYSHEELQAALDSASGTRKLSEFVNQNLVIESFTEESGQYGVYAVIHATTLDGEEVTISSGGRVVVPQLKKLESMDAFPVEVTVVSFPGQFGKDGYKFEVA